MLRRCALVLPLAALVACSSSGPGGGGTGGPGGGGGGGATPAISELAFAPPTLAVSTTSAVKLDVKLTFTDADGDVVAMGGQAKYESGAEGDLGRTTITGATQGMKAGQVTVSLQVSATHEDKITFTLFLIDKAGHESNRVVGSVEIK